MKTMIWKELRENFKWAVLALIVLTAAEFYALNAGQAGYGDESLTLCNATFLMATSFGCALIGAALGAVQILPEQRRDQWASLLHRPVTRSAIFFGKVFPGLLLYFFATTLPFLACTAYVAVPGRFASPLVPGVLLPGLSDLFLGVVFYFEAILLCLHRGRWFGGRGFIGLSVLSVFILHISTGWPFMLPLLASGVLLLASWGTMLSNGPIQSRHWAARMALVSVMLLGATTGCLIVVWVLQFLPSKTVPFPFIQFEITRDGQIFNATQNGDGMCILTDTNGKAITDERYVGNSGNQNFLQLLPFLWNIGKEENLRDYFLGTQPRNPENYVSPMRQNYGSKELWYLLVRQNYFIGYDKLSRRCVGIFDREGFKSPGSVPRPFAHPLRFSSFFNTKPLFYWSGPQLYAFDVIERTMTPFFNSQNETIYAASTIFIPNNGGKSDPVAVATKNEIHVFDAQGKPLFTIPYNHDTGGLTWITHNESLDRFYVQYTPDYWSLSGNEGAKVKSVFLDVLDGKGTLIQTYSHDSERIVQAPPTWAGQFSKFSSPLLPVSLSTIYYHFHELPVVGYSSINYPSLSLKVTTQEIQILIAIAFALSAITLLWAKQAGFSGRHGWYWALFVFCFGLPGLITFRLTSIWPTRVRCAQCGHKRPVETETCPHCHQAWPRPRATGVEIFDLEGKPGPTVETISFS